MQVFGSYTPHYNMEKTTLSTNTSKSKKEKASTKSQDANANVQSIREFVGEMKKIQICEWKHVNTHLETIGSSYLQIPIWKRKSLPINNSNRASSSKNSSQDMLDLIDIMLKSIRPDQEVFICNLPKCNKRFVDRSKFRRHLHNHARIRRKKSESILCLPTDTGLSTPDKAVIRISLKNSEGKNRKKEEEKAQVQFNQDHENSDLFQENIIEASMNVDSENRE